MPAAISACTLRRQAEVPSGKVTDRFRRLPDNRSCPHKKNHSIGQRGAEHSKELGRGTNARVQNINGASQVCSRSTKRQEDNASLED